jgi:hypothetical protein
LSKEGQQARRLPALSENRIQLLQTFSCARMTVTKKVKHFPNTTGTAPARKGSIVEARLKRLKCCDFSAHYFLQKIMGPLLDVFQGANGLDKSAAGADPLQNLAEVRWVVEIATAASLADPAV